MVSLPNGVTSIVQSAFDGCSNMTKIFVPISVTFIDKHAFRNAPNLVIYAEATSQPSGWDKQWNKDNHTVYWGQSSY